MKQIISELHLDWLAASALIGSSSMVIIWQF